MSKRTKFIIYRIINLASYALFALFTALNNITFETGLFWLLLGCMIVNQITSRRYSELEE